MEINEERPGKGRASDEDAATDDVPLERASKASAADPAQDIERRALQLLSRREHSIQELRLKLQRKGHPPAVVEPIIAKLSAKRLVSDERFTAAIIRHRAQRGQGPVRIRAELRQQGIADDCIQQAFEHAEPADDTAAADPEAVIDWQGLAAQVRRRKFGAAAPRSPQAQAKQARFLQYRGFTTEQIRFALHAGACQPETDDSVDAANGAWDDD